MATMGALSNKQWDVLYKLSLGVYIYIHIITGDVPLMYGWYSFRATC